MTCHETFYTPQAAGLQATQRHTGVPLRQLSSQRIRNLKSARKARLLGHAVQQVDAGLQT